MRYDVVVERFSLLKRLVQFDLTDFATHGGLCQLRDGINIIVDAIGGFVRVEHFQIQHAVNDQRNVVSCNGCLRGYVNGLLFERTVVGHTVKEGI